jgi:hypothetical protein
MYTGEEKYRRWVLDYVQAWAERTQRNGGIMPDNIGPTGKIGERIGGKWWGGYYGWRWPHGAWIILESTLNAGCSATLLTGDPSWLDLHRSQADLLWSLRKEEDGVMQIPARHGDQGWFDYRPPVPKYYVYLWFLSQSEEDRARLQARFPNRQALQEDPGFFKAGKYSPLSWFAYAVEGTNPDFPDRVLDDTYEGICRRLEMIEQDDDDVENWDVHHWQNRNPVIPEGLIQMTMGTPAAVYHGGLLHASVRYFDPRRRRPGLPPHVAALVEKVTSDGILLTLVNTDPLETRDVVVQAGAFGEHAFTQVEPKDATDATGQRVVINAKHLRVSLGPSAQARLELGILRLAHRPSYDFPRFES